MKKDPERVGKKEKRKKREGGREENELIEVMPTCRYYCTNMK